MQQDDIPRRFRTMTGMAYGQIRCKKVETFAPAGRRVVLDDLLAYACVWVVW